MTEITCFCAGLIVGGLFVGLVCWMVNHPGCLVTCEKWLDKIEEWAEKRLAEKYREAAKKYD